MFAIPVFSSAVTPLPVLSATTPTVSLAQAVASVLLVCLASPYINKSHASPVTSMDAQLAVVTTHALTANQDFPLSKII
jgi:hypothetical protein